eukprot:g23900.t1
MLTLVGLQPYLEVTPHRFAEKVPRAPRVTAERLLSSGLRLRDLGEDRNHRNHRSQTTNECRASRGSWRD